jgi:hypothetical protein
LTRLGEIGPPLYSVKPLTALDTGSTHVGVFLDAVLISEVDQLSDVVVEIKIARNPDDPYLSRRVRDGRRQLLDLLSTFRRTTSRDAKGWLIVVVDGDVDPARRRSLEGRFNRTDGDTVYSIVGVDYVGDLTLPQGLLS